MPLFVTRKVRSHITITMSLKRMMSLMVKVVQTSDIFT